MAGSPRGPVPIFDSNSASRVGSRYSGYVAKVEMGNQTAGMPRVFLPREKYLL